ncbi:MAG: hypothetical protein AVDCRST_MAG12-2069, partial [uncultured Rubrobacteraceae bacterium]
APGELSGVSAPVRAEPRGGVPQGRRGARRGGGHLPHGQHAGAAVRGPRGGAGAVRGALRRGEADGAGPALPPVLRRDQGGRPGPDPGPPRPLPDGERLRHRVDHYRPGRPGRRRSGAPGGGELLRGSDGHPDQMAQDEDEAGSSPGPARGAV